MKSTAVGTACPEDVAAIVADRFAATLNRRYAAPPPLSVTLTGALVSARVSSGYGLANPWMRLRKFQLGCV
jgi:hypothetical protein